MKRTRERTISTIYGAVCLLFASCVGLMWFLDYHSRSLHHTDGDNLKGLWKLALIAASLGMHLISGSRWAQAIFAISCFGIGCWLLFGAQATRTEMIFALLFFVPAILTFIAWKKVPTQLQHGT